MLIIVSIIICSINISVNNNYVLISGLIILILFIAVSFIGYILIWGNLSYWGITVILTLLNSLYNIPYIVCGNCSNAMSYICYTQ